MNNLMFRLWAVTLIGCCLASPSVAVEKHFPKNVGSNAGCNHPAYKVCTKRNTVCKPPSVHPGVAFGYYPTTWTRASVEVEIREIAPKSARPGDSSVEPLPMPRPIEPQRDSTGMALPSLRSAGIGR